MPLTEELLSCDKIKGFPLFVRFAFIFYRVMTFIRYIGIDFTFGLADCVRYNEDLLYQDSLYRGSVPYILS